ncbi:YjbH domain-containing protein [Palleronia caenipelagi]|nr:YjbH domain-containing protein [Palleronia caenipelagi]
MRRSARPVFTALMGLTALVAVPASAETLRFPNLNFYGMTGAIDTPTALSQPDAEVGVTFSRFADLARTTLSFQVLPRVQAAFRYSGFLPMDPEGGNNEFDFWDRSFDITVQLLDEQKYLPAVKIGVQDFIGTGIQSSEYVVATKRFWGDTVTVSAGLGWGRLGRYDDIGTPFGDRPDRDYGLGGKLELDGLFRGPVAPFGSIIWRPNDKLSVFAEYSSDTYGLETGFESDSRNRMFDRDTPMNYGISYRFNNAVELGAYSLFGSEVGVRLSFNGNPSRPPVVGQTGPGPGVVAQRPSRASAPQQWSTGWRAIPEVEQGLMNQLNRQLEDDGVEVVAMRVVSGSDIEVTVRNSRYPAPAQAIGRVSRAMTRVLPSSIETFRVVMEREGLRSSQTILRRSDLERLVNSPDAAEQLLARTQITEAGPAPVGTVVNAFSFPKFSWSLSPYLRRVFFDPTEPVRLEFGVELGAEYEPVDGLVFSGTVAQRLLGDTSTNVDYRSNLPAVRTDASRYADESNFGIENLQGAYYFNITENVYGRVTAGYLERMFGGVSAEALWKPVGSKLGLGVELSYAKKRDYDRGFGFRDYDVVTGHLAAYYELPMGFDLQVLAGRYLAEDWGATVALQRTFANGWEIGAYATKTDVSDEDFGEGSFDKGISVKIPVTWFSGKPSRSSFNGDLRSLERDGGAILRVSGRLYNRVRGRQETEIVEQWGSVWR